MVQFAAIGNTSRACLAIRSVAESRVPKAICRSGRSATYDLRDIHRRDGSAPAKQVVAKEATAAPDRSDPRRPGPGCSSRAQGRHRAARHALSGTRGGGAGPPVATPCAGPRLPGETLAASTLTAGFTTPSAPADPEKGRLIPSPWGYRVIAIARLCKRASNCGLFRKPNFRSVAHCCRSIGQQWEGTK